MWIFMKNNVFIQDKGTKSYKTSLEVYPIMFPQNKDMNYLQ